MKVFLLFASLGVTSSFIVPSVAAEPREALTLEIRINQNLPLHVFRLLADPEAEAADGRRRIGRIEISGGGAASSRQTIEVHSHAHPSRLTESFRAEDVNFDGYLDLAVLDDHGAKWGKMNYWLFDKRTGRFTANALSKQLGALRFNDMRLDEKAKEIEISNLVTSCAEDKRVYKVAGERLIVVRAEEREATAAGCVVTTKKRSNGQLKVLGKKLEPHER